MVIRPDDPQEMAAAIFALKADPARLGEMGRRARQAAEAKYAEPLIIEKYKTALADHLTVDRVNKKRNMKVQESNHIPARPD